MSESSANHAATQLLRTKLASQKLNSDDDFSLRKFNKSFTNKLFKNENFEKMFLF